MATSADTTRSGRSLKIATPIVVAMTTCTRNAAAAPNHTAIGFPRDARTSDANIVLSGSSPKKMTGKTAAAIAKLILRRDRPSVRSR